MLRNSNIPIKKTIKLPTSTREIIFLASSIPPPLDSNKRLSLIFPSLIAKWHARDQLSQRATPKLKLRNFFSILVTNLDNKLNMGDR